MRITVDKDNDTLYFRLDETPVAESEEIQPGVIIDYDKNNRVIGMELLNISTRVATEDLTTISFKAA